ncbi:MULTISPECIES: hypothetical protein [Streptomyces]|uniref:hypothetical protein n=1 Tax=Streptomyces TaxID=1883 RepID=UPI00324EB3D6
MTAVGWDEEGWDDDEPAPTPAVPAYYCEGPCCQARPSLLRRLLAALHLRPPA